MTCGNCGSPVPDTAMFCPECGADVRARDEEDADGAAAVDEGAAGAGDAASGTGGQASSSGDWASGSDGQSSDTGPWSSGTADAASDAADATSASSGRTSSSGDAGSEFDWGGTSVDDDAEDDGLNWGVQESADLGGPGGAAAGDGEDGSGPEPDADADDEDQPFPEPTRLSRPADSSHPEPVMGTEGEVVGHRVGAFLVDRFLLTVLAVAPFVAAVVLEPLVADLAGVVLLVGYLGATVGGLVYTLLLEGMYGQTPGKRLFGIVVVKEDGEPCTVGASILRSVLWVVDRFYLGLVGFMLVVATDRNQRVGDMVADTVVVRTA